MLDCTDMATTDGVRLAVTPSFNGNNPFTYLVLFRIGAGGQSPDAIGAGQFFTIVALHDSTAGSIRDRIDLTIFNNGATRFMQPRLRFTAQSWANITPAQIDPDITTWSELIGRYVLCAIQYRGSSLAHKMFFALWDGADDLIVTEHTASANVGVNALSAPNCTCLGHHGLGNSTYNANLDFLLTYMFHDETWDLATFTAVADSLIDDADGSLKSPAGPINLVSGTRTGVANCEWVGPALLYDRSTSFNEVLPGTELTTGIQTAAIAKTTGFVQGAATTNGSGAGPVLLDPAGYFAADPDDTPADVQAAGTIKPDLKGLIDGATNGRKTIFVVSNSRNGRPDDGRGNTNVGVTPVLKAGHALDATQYPGGKMGAPSSYGGGISLARPGTVIGCLSFMPQTAWAAGVNPRRTQVCVDLAATAGSPRTATVLDGLVARHNDNAGRFSLWDNFGPSINPTGGQPYYIAPGQQADFWFYHTGAMSPEAGRVLTAIFAQMPTNADTAVEMRVLSHGAITNPTPFPSTGTPDFVGSAFQRTVSGTLRGSSSNPTIDMDGTAVAVPPASITGESPQAGDVCVIEAGNLSPHAISVFATAPDGSGAATFEHPPNADFPAVFLVRPVAKWGPYSVIKHEIGVQAGVPDSDGPFVGMRVAVPAGEAAGVYLLAWGVRMIDGLDDGFVYCDAGQGGGGYATQVAQKFTTPDASGSTPIGKLFAAINPDIAFMFPAEQSSVPADTQDYIDLILEGAPGCEVVGVRAPTYAETAFTAGSNLDGWSTWMVDNTSPGVKLLGAFSPAHAWLMGYYIDSQHLGPRGSEMAANLMFEQLGSLPAALPSVPLRVERARNAERMR